MTEATATVEMGKVTSDKILPWVPHPETPIYNEVLAAFHQGKLSASEPAETDPKPTEAPPSVPDPQDPPVGPPTPQDPVPAPARATARRKRVKKLP